MHVFRRQGYAATTVRDLEAASGLTSGSLYNSYGNKQGLFQAASAHYNRQILAGRLKTHAPEGSAIGGLRRLFLSLLQEPGGGHAGCLITNSAVEFGDTEVPEFVTEGFKALQSVFTARLGGEASAAMELLAFYQGILVLIRAGSGSVALKWMINDYFDKLETSVDAETLWSLHAKIWSADPARCQSELQVCLAADATDCDLNGPLDGPAALSGYMGGFQQSLPGVRFEILQVIAHHDRSLARWVLRGTDDAVLQLGVSLATQDAQGRLPTIAGSFRLPPPRLPRVAST